ncbi:MAG: peptidoglycan DD-metalloendopeptidase family protein [Kangiellaceae bacterium]|nr:peptidoglycan DD-metalloendopeptidase family protein [Kangiellaceae bacterium]
MQQQKQHNNNHSDNDDASLKGILKRSALRALWLVLIVFVVYLQQGCGNKRLAPVEERDATGQKAVSSSFYPPTEVDNSQQYYRVRKGDTLYSIAFRYGVDFKTLAKVNHIDNNYTIHPGQRINLQKARETAGSNDDSTVNPQVAKNTSDPSNTTTNTNNTSTQRPTKPTEVKRQAATKPVTQTANKTNVTKPTVTAKPVDKKAVNNAANNDSQPSKKQTQPIQTVANTSLGNQAVKYWMWPAMGQIITRFSGAAKKAKGIDIAGNLGDPVRAAAAGRVVYAGRGLRGYGNLVIIKHNNDFISAYAHNKKLLVKENEIIKAGQKIAEIGNTDSDIPKLHFEIRYRGKPTDPMRYLPKR